MMYKKKNKKQYIQPTITVKKLMVHLFSRRNFELGPLALCFSCFGDTCPEGCSRSCFVSGTRVLASNKYRSIETLKVGDEVATYNFSKKQVINAKIVKIINGTSTHLIKINNVINVTPEHRFWINSKKWLRIKNVKLGDFLFSSKGTKIPIFSLELIERVIPVFNLHLSGHHHTYFAEDVLVHNWK